MSEQKVLMPQTGESIQEGTLTKWHKKVGEAVQREEILFEISTDKVDTEIPSPATGTLTQILVEEGSTVAVNSVVGILETDATAAAAAAPSQQAAAPQTPAAAAPASTAPATENSASVLASPLAKKIAKEHEVDLSKIQGSGEQNKIVKNDVLSALGQAASSSPLVQNAISQAATAASVSSAPSPGNDEEVSVDGVRIKRVGMTSMRKRIAQHMVESKKTSPHVTSVIEIDLQKIVDIRQKNKSKFQEAHGTKLSFMPFFMYAAVEAIKAVPIVNASVEGDSILYKKDINLGIAVALDWGLIVPVIKNAAEKSFAGLAKDLAQLADKARQKKLAPSDVKGGTFSITNFGSFGTVIGQPIINQPQVAIFGLGAMQKKPVVVHDDAIAVHTTCHCVLSFDHRVIDGADSGKFLSKVKDVLENWDVPVL